MHTRKITPGRQEKECWPKQHDSCFESRLRTKRVQRPTYHSRPSNLHITATDLLNAELRDPRAADGHMGEAEPYTGLWTATKVQHRARKGLKMDFLPHPFILATTCRKHGVV
jgi:hypothetical protein